MLVLKRKKGQAIEIAEGIFVTFLGLKGKDAILGIEAEKNIPILRKELTSKPANSK